MIKTLVTMSVFWVLVASCQGGGEGISNRSSTIGTGALANKSFSDDAFLCAQLTDLGQHGDKDKERESEGAETAATADEERQEDVTIVDAENGQAKIFALAETVSYDGKIKALLAAKCVSCHKPGGTPPDVSTYDTAKAAGADSLRTIEDGSMPTSGPLPDPDKLAFKAWVDGGYLKSDAGTSTGSGTGGKDPKKSSDGKKSGGSSPAGSCQANASDSDKSSSDKTKTNNSGNAKALQATFQGGIKALLDSKCNACHKAGGTPPDLTSYDKAKAEGDSSLATIEDGSMPPSKPLADDQKSLFKKWSEAGYPEK